MNVIRILIISFIVLINTNIAFSQNSDLKKSEKIELIGGKKYYIHKVEKGQTIYSICKLYEISQKELSLDNPEIKDGLKLNQELKIPIVEKVAKSDNYIYHKVNKNETAYFIAKKYGISVDELFILNPKAKDGLKIGEELKIKKTVNTQETHIITNTVEPKEDIIPTVEKNNYLKHKVKKKETLYSISKLYDISTEEILKSNPDVRENGLKKGEIINIPSKEFLKEISKAIDNSDTLSINDSIVADTVDCILVSDFNKTRTLKIGLLLPFELDIKTLKIELEKNEDLHSDALPKTKPFFEFYQGLLLSLNEFKKNNISFDLYVYNTKKDAKIAKSIIQKPEIKQLDFIIGPIYKNVFDTVLKYVPQGIAIINPLIDVSKSKSQTNVVIQNKPSKLIIYNEIVKYVSSFENANYIIIHNGTKEETKLISDYKHLLQNSLPNINDSIYIKIVNFNDGKLKAIKNSIEKDRTNIVIIPSTEQGFVTNVITNLHVASVEDSIILIGMDEWLKYNVEVKYFHSLNLTVFKSRYIDYKNENVLKFQKEFMDEYVGVPSVYSFVGYDTFNYYINAFMQLNDNFSNCLDIYSHQELSLNFNFEKVDNTFINKAMYIVQYKKDLTIELIAE